MLPRQKAKNKLFNKFKKLKKEITIERHINEPIQQTMNQVLLGNIKDYEDEIITLFDSNEFNHDITFNENVSCESLISNELSVSGESLIEILSVNSNTTVNGNLNVNSNGYLNSSVYITDNIVITPNAKQTLTDDDQTINIGKSLILVDSGGDARTGIILQSTATNSVDLTIINMGDETITFDTTPDTSNISINTLVMESKKAYKFVSYNSVWYPVG